MSSRILVVDNYDSFVYTIVGYLQQLGADTTVVRNDDVPPASEFDAYDGILVSPGPGAPKEAGATLEVIEACAERGTPMLGVCLGHQALGEVFGGVVTHASELMHGKTSAVIHEGAGVFTGLPTPFTATRYHSLAVVRETVSEELTITAETAHGIVMGLEHRNLPLHGVQFHPEAVLTEGGHLLLANWLAVTGDAEAVSRAQGLAPLVRQ
ncbi:aminodeoxychorismate/anthranilate synthase component II [Bogoriella caseilytica]|uniref:Para-aminobenzoate synthetase component 2 n=1 Tax=Bogoriella caseilytica TaxID=56055 RepID=A0A3N2BCF0_9MICO|nr:aminodeoxychorismate/anthranilate synthase component II [Bogoriella caseilytica]ROR72915.1 para-aminobenzoate synthetase component 2 [Bogoriella caseilytica]